MQSHEYEIKCKKALISILYEIYGERLTIEKLAIVWFSKTLKNFKCVIVDLRSNVRYYECTYNGETDEIYFDIYQKQFNMACKASNLPSEDIR